MAKRPAWSVQDDVVICENFDFMWSGGFSITQKQKNIRALHQSIYEMKHEKALEVSSKSEVRVGKEIGAFSLELDGIFLENVFQAAKQYENGGPYLDLLNVSPKQAKRDERHCNSGKLVGFVRNDEIWTLEPKTAFYDYIYISALIKNFGYDLNISEYQWFTDIEFNPQKSINCQARAVAIYVALGNCIYIMPEIPFTDNETIDKYELTNVRIYAEFNERLYLCYKFGKNVDPMKDLVFNRPIPIEYKEYIDIISS